MFQYSFWNGGSVAALLRDLVLHRRQAFLEFGLRGLRHRSGGRRFGVGYGAVRAPGLIEELVAPEKQRYVSYRTGFLLWKSWWYASAGAKVVAERISVTIGLANRFEAPRSRLDFSASRFWSSPW